MTSKPAKTNLPGNPIAPFQGKAPSWRVPSDLPAQPYNAHQPLLSRPTAAPTRRSPHPSQPVGFSPLLLKRSLLVGSTLLAGALLILTGNLINPRSLLSARDPNAECQGKVQSQSVVSREQLSRLLTVAERDRKAKVRQIVKAPYCTLPSVEVRAGVKAEREAYPLAFDPQTRLVILYEGDEYAGYAFDVRH